MPGQRQTNTFEEDLARILNLIGQAKQTSDADVPWLTQFETMGLARMHKLQSDSGGNPAFPSEPDTANMSAMPGPGSAVMPPSADPLGGPGGAGGAMPGMNPMTDLPPAPGPAGSMPGLPAGPMQMPSPDELRRVLQGGGA